jgi:putative ABC transport system permease protein
MNLHEAFRMALLSLRTNKLRSGLTMVGIVIGVMAVIALVGLGEGVKAGFNKEFGAFATAIIVQKSDGEVPGGGSPRALKDGDVTALSNPRAAPDLSVVTPVLSGNGIFRHGPGLQFSGTVTGSTTDYLWTNNRELTAGSMFTEADQKHAAKVVVLGSELVADLYAGQPAPALNSKVRIGRMSFRVAGVLERNGRDDDIGLMPLNTARAYLLGGNDTITSIVGKAVSVDRVDAATDEITKIMSSRRNIRDPTKIDFKITALQSQLDQINQFLSYLTMFIVAVAAISLLVGAIGVANIMLVSVTERTHEIGIRKAIGARRGSIRKQFLIESATLAGVGGLIGVVLGVGLVLAGAQVIVRVLPNFGAPQVSAPAILAAFAVSLGTGLLAGCYPAFRAARLDPIEALRYQ